jgi:hypothetical protein
MSRLQVEAVARILCDLRATDLHHGDCFGADKDAHMIGLVLDLTMHLHVPSATRFRAFCEVRLGVDVVYAPKPYLERDHDIVNATTALIATPKQMTEHLRSGTWATVRYARTVGRAIYVVWPTGEVSKE